MIGLKFIIQTTRQSDTILEIDTLAWTTMTTIFFKCLAIFQKKLRVILNLSLFIQSSFIFSTSKRPSKPVLTGFNNSNLFSSKMSKRLDAFQ